MQLRLEVNENVRSFGSRMAPPSISGTSSERVEWRHLFYKGAPESSKNKFISGLQTYPNLHPPPPVYVLRWGVFHEGMRICVGLFLFGAHRQGCEGTRKAVKTVTAVFRVFRLFFGCFTVTHSAPFSAVCRLFSMLGIWHLCRWLRRLQGQAR